MSVNKIRITYLQRKTRSVGNYSLEFIFADVRNRLQNQIEAKTVYCKYESSGLFKRAYNVFQAFRNQGKQITHVTGDVNYIGALLTKRKTIHTVLDCVFLKNTSGLKYKILKYFWMDLPIRKSQFVTAISESTKTEILKYTNCDSNKIVVIPVAISNRYQPYAKETISDKPVILQLGTAPNKNIDILIEAIKDIDCKLIIVGAHHQQYENLLKEHKIDYQYLQGLSDGEILNLYQQCDIVSLVSTYEGFGMPILEGQAVGRVVITANLFSMPEVGGNGAHYVDPYNVVEIKEGIQKLIADENYRNTLIQNGFENVKRFDAQHIANQYLELYKKVVS
jgi:glycosyltransferase involved in cell wall biosynthesis